MNIIKSFLTKLIYKTGNLILENYKTKKIKEKNIMYYSFNKNNNHIGQVTIFNDIIINKTYIKKHNINFELLIFHELGHKKDNLKIVLMILASFFGIELICASLIFLINIFTYIISFENIINGIITNLILFMLCSWILELRAEFYCAKTLRYNLWIKKRNLLKKTKNSFSFFENLIYYVTHPPIKLVIKLFSINYFKKKLI
ncbi:MAG: hypothetical protein PHN56_05440 [Candidatus Nanoarchaeia archaeon]|nr:hypothetical protein [Candidatus Nanoarchaeia archaeon]